MDFKNMIERLPVTMSRTEVPKLLGGIVSSKSLANADSLGVGPEGRFKIGRRVCYQTDPTLGMARKKNKIAIIL